MSEQELKEKILEELSKQKRAISDDLSISDKTRTSKIKQINDQRQILLSFTLDQIESNFIRQKSHVDKIDNHERQDECKKNFKEKFYDSEGKPISTNRAMYAFKKIMCIYSIQRNNARLNKIIKTKENIIKKFNKNQTQSNGSN